MNYPLCKIFDLRTEIVKEFVNDDTEKWLWIDILPLDGLPDDDYIIEKMFRKSLIARKILRIKKSKKTKGNNILKIIFKPILKLILTPIPLVNVVSYIDDVSRTYSIEECNFIGGVAMGYGPNEKMPKEEYLKSVKVKFEGIEINAPSCWDYYLKSLYGDYMVLPPKNKQVAHPMSIWINE